MITDQELTFSDAQAVTAAANSTNVVDLGPKHASNPYRDIGVGVELWLVVTVVVAMTDAGSDSTIAVTWVTDDNDSFSSATTLFTVGTFAAVSPVGTQIKFRLPSANYEQYNRLVYTPANGNLSTGSFTASITRNAPHRRDYFATPQSSAE